MNNEESKRELTDQEHSNAYARQQPGSGEKHDKHADTNAIIDTDDGVEDFADWKFTELKAFAKENDIDLGDARKKVDIVDVLNEWYD